MENRVSISSWELFKAHGDNLIILKATCATPNMCRCVQVTFSVAVDYVVRLGCQGAHRRHHLRTPPLGRSC